MQAILFLTFLTLEILSFDINSSPETAVLVFEKGEGGYYCHKIPYLFHTNDKTLLALAEGRGRDGRESCDDFSVCLIVCVFLNCL